MPDLVHRLRRIAAMASDARVRSLDLALRADATGARALMECRDARAIAHTLQRVCDALGFESNAHAERLVTWCRGLGRLAGLSPAELDDLELGCRVHDVGKLAVTADVLGDDDALTATELDWIRMHASLGHALLAGVPGMAGARELVICHHEYFDGTGYPDGRRGSAIPRIARIFTIVDSFEAIVRDDVRYRDPRSQASALDELASLAGTRYDAALVSLWIDYQTTQALAGAIFEPALQPNTLPNSGVA